MTRSNHVMVGIGFQLVAADPKTEVVITVFSDPRLTIAARKTGPYEVELQELFKAVVGQAEAGEL